MSLPCLSVYWSFIYPAGRELPCSLYLSLSVCLAVSFTLSLFLHNSHILMVYFDHEIIMEGLEMTLAGEFLCDRVMLLKFVPFLL